MSDLIFRHAQPDDAALVFSFVKKLAVYEQLAEKAVSTPEDIRQALSECLIYAIVVEDGSGALGFCTYYFTYTTFLGRAKLFVEDIFIEPEHRRKGAGRALLNEMARIATERNCARMEFQVLDWNDSAVDFYESCGAEFVTNWLPYSVDCDNFKTTAAGEKSKD